MNDKNIGNQSTQQEVNTFKATADKTAAHCLHFNTLLSKATYSAFRLYIIYFIIFYQYVCVPWELNPWPFALLTQCSTTEPQEHC